MTETSFLDGDGVVRLRGTLDPPPGGSTAGAVRTLGPFPLAFDDEVTPGVLGIALFTPAVGDLLIDWRYVGDTDWNGTWTGGGPLLWLKLGATPWSPTNAFPPGGDSATVLLSNLSWDLSGDLGVSDAGAEPTAADIRDGLIYAGPYTSFTPVLSALPLIALVTDGSGDPPAVAPTTGGVDIYVDVVTPATP